MWSQVAPNIHFGAPAFTIGLYKNTVYAAQML